MKTQKTCTIWSFQLFENYLPTSACEIKVAPGVKANFNSQSKLKVNINYKTLLVLTLLLVVIFQKTKQL